MKDPRLIIYIVVILAGLLIFFAVKTGRLTKKNEQLQILYQAALEDSITDYLTKLYNIRHLTARLKEEIARAIRFSHIIQILYIDLDNFKEVNDNLGHNAGDEVLKQTADIIRKCLRQYDLVARGAIGDEFVAVLPKTSRKLCLRAAKAILEQIEKININGGEIKISASIGVHQFDGKRAEEWREKDTAKLAEESIGAADRAMYEAKAAGKGRVAASAPKRKK